MGGPSAWRLNKAEQVQVRKDLEVWEAQNEELKASAKDEYDRKLGEEKKRLERVIQEAKHLKSLQRQSAKAKAAPKNAPADQGAGSSSAVGPGLKDAGVNESYMQSLKNDLQVIADQLGDLKSELPVPIVQGDDSKGGVQEHFCFNILFPFHIPNHSHSLLTIKNHISPLHSEAIKP